MNAKVRVPDLAKYKQQGEKITVATAYDFTMASLVDRAGVDVILVGDSLGTVVQGHENTLKVSMQQMLYHAEMVTRAVKRALVVVDMPFLSYRVSREQALSNAGRLIQESGAEAVKLEGGLEIAGIVQFLVESGIPVVGHLGLTPQSYHVMGGHRVQGRTPEEAAQIEESAQVLEEVGAFAIVLEGVPRELATKITKSLTIPTIGIGAGVDCSGQVLVLNDILGISLEDQDFPKFVKNFGNLGQEIDRCLHSFIEEVKSGSFPADQHSYSSAGPRLVTSKPD